MDLRFSELRAEGDCALAGVVVAYGNEARLPWGRERIEPSSFEDRADVILNVGHDRGRPLARTGGGGLELRDTPEALTMLAELPPTRESGDVIELVRRGILAGLSVEMRVTGERMEGDLRIVTRASLVGLAVVDRPAYDGSVVQARMAELAATRTRRRRVLGL